MVALTSNLGTQHLLAERKYNERHRLKSYFKAGCMVLESWIFYRKYSYTVIYGELRSYLSSSYHTKVGPTPWGNFKL